MNDLQKYVVTDEALMPATMDGMMKQAAALVKSGLLPPDVKTAEAALAIMLTGRELGIPPMQAFRSIYIVKGRPTLSAQLMGAMILKAGHTYQVVIADNATCSIKFTRRGGQSYTHTFTLADAKTAKLADGDTWSKYPKAMLFSRCMSAGARIAMPDVIAGMYTPEELSDPTTVQMDTETGEVLGTAHVVEGTPAPVVEAPKPAAAMNDNGKGQLPHWTKNADERAAWDTWKLAAFPNLDGKAALLECKRLVGLTMGLGAPVDTLTKFPGDRQALQDAIETAMQAEADVTEIDEEKMVA